MLTLCSGPSSKYWREEEARLGLLTRSSVQETEPASWGQKPAEAFGSTEITEIRLGGGDGRREMFPLLFRFLQATQKWLP